MCSVDIYEFHFKFFVMLKFLCISPLFTSVINIIFSLLFFFFFFSFFSFNLMATHHQILSYSCSNETVNNGLNVVIDTQMCSWRCARNAIQYVSESLACNATKLYAIRPEVFWDKQRIENCTKAQKYLDVSQTITFDANEREFRKC